MFGESNGQIKLHAKQKFKFLSATDSVKSWEGMNRLDNFLRVLVLCEMQSVSSRTWTRVTVSISYDDNHYTTGTS